MKKHSIPTSRHHWRWIPALTLSLLAITPLPAAHAEDGVEAAQSSNLVKLALPSIAARSTNPADIEKFASALATVAGVNNGKISATEVLVWEKSAQPLIKFPAALRAAGYKYLPQPSREWPDLGQVTPFGLESADQSRRFVGFWVEQGEYIILAWGRFQADATPKDAPANKLTPPTTNSSNFRVADATMSSVIFQPPNSPPSPKSLLNPKRCAVR